MDMNQALVARIQELAKQNNISLCDMALRGGLSPSTLYEMIKGRTRVASVLTISRLCEGAGISLSEFFDSPYFAEYFEK